MGKAAAPPKKPTQTPTGWWLLYLVALPWLPLFTGLLIVLFAKTRPEPLSLVEGVAVSLYAVALLAGTVCAFKAPSPPKISQRLKVVTSRVLLTVVFVSAGLVMIWQMDQVINTGVFLGAQFLLAMTALPFSWKARA